MGFQICNKVDFKEIRLVDKKTRTHEFEKITTNGVLKEINTNVPMIFRTPESNLYHFEDQKISVGCECNFKDSLPLGLRRKIVETIHIKRTS